jgi:drug/metabolite transporter (DMT)-like permease
MIMPRAAPLQLLAFATAFAMVGICTGLALEGGANPLTVVTIRSVGTLAFFVLYFLVAGVAFRLAPRDLAIACAIGIPLAINNYLINAAMAELPVPLVVLIFYLWPGLTSAISWLMGRDPFRWRVLVGLALAFAGLALALNVDFTAAQARGAWYAAGAALNWTVTFLLTGHFFRGRDTRAPTFWMVLVASTFFVGACIVTGDVVPPKTAPGWSGALGISLFYAVGMIGIFAATAKYGPTRTGFYMNFEPIASVLLAALILGQTLSPVQLAGAALVVAALFLFRPGN